MYYQDYENISHLSTNINHYTTSPKSFLEIDNSGFTSS